MGSSARISSRSWLTPSEFLSHAASSMIASRAEGPRTAAGRHGYAPTFTPDRSSRTSPTLPATSPFSAGTSSNGSLMYENIVRTLARWSCATAMIHWPPSAGSPNTLS